MAGDRQPLERFARSAPNLGDRAELRLFLRRLAQLLAMLVVLVVLGTAGFALSEGVSAWDGFVWTLDTVATLGSIQAPQNTSTEIIKAVLIVFGVGTLFYALVTLTEVFVAGHLGALLLERREQRMIDAMSDHYVICGFGRVGRQVARDLRAANAGYVVIDSNPDIRETAQEAGVRFIEGSPSEDDSLRRAGIERARAVIACVDSDAENIFITLSARELRPDVTIVARASAEDTEKKLRRAGADRVISPYKSSGTEMARLALSPQVTGVVDVAPEYRMEEIEVSAGCEGDGMSVGDVRGDAMIVAVRRDDGEFVAMPQAELVIGSGDVVVAMGPTSALARLEGLFSRGAGRGAPEPAA